MIDQATSRTSRKNTGMDRRDQVGRAGAGSGPQVTADREKGGATPMNRSLQLPPEQLHAMALAFGDQPAYLVVGGPSMTFDQWDTDASRLARGLIDRRGPAR